MARQEQPGTPTEAWPPVPVLPVPLSPSQNADEVVPRARELIQQIVAARGGPDPKWLHELAAILEQEEARYQEQAGQLNINARTNYTIGRLIKLVRGNDELFELVSHRFLLGSHPKSLQAAAARLTLACAYNFQMFPFMIENEALLNKLIEWSTGDKQTGENSKEENRKIGVWRSEAERDEAMLWTYATGLLALALQTDGMTDDVVRRGTVVCLVRYLRKSVLGNVSPGTDAKKGGGTDTPGRGRVRPPLDASLSDGGRVLFQNVSSASGSRATRVDGHAQELLVEDDLEAANEENAQPLVWTQVPEVQGSRGKGRSMQARAGTPSDVGNAAAALQDLAGSQSLKFKAPPDQEDESQKGESARLEANASVNGAVSSKEAGEGSSRVADNEEVDLVQLILKAREAAETEAREAGAPAEVASAAGEDAAEAVKLAASEALASGKSPEEVLVSAKQVAESIASASRIAEEGRAQLEQANNSKKEPDPDKAAPEQVWVVSPADLAHLREQFTIQSLAMMGEYLEALGPVLHEKGVDVCLTLLRRHSAPSVPSTPGGTTPSSNLSAADGAFLTDVLKLVCSLLAHKRFGCFFVDKGGVELLLALPRGHYSQTGVSLCLFALASIQGVMERVCQLPNAVVRDCVGLALALLGTASDPARKNAALFLGAAFVFRAVVEAFDAQDGLRRVLNLLRAASAMRAVMTSPSRQVTFHACLALRQYMRAQLVHLSESLRPPSKVGGSRGGRASARALYRPADLGDAAIEALANSLQRDRRLGPAFMRSRWPALDNFLDLGGPPVILELAQLRLGGAEKYTLDAVHAALGVLFLVTLMPYAHRPVVGAQLISDESRTGMAVLLEAVSPGAFADYEVTKEALRVLVNLVSPPASLCKPVIQASQQSQQTQAPLQGTPVGEKRISLGLSLGHGGGAAGLATYMEQGYRFARDCVRQHNGIKIFLSLLQPRPPLPTGAADAVRTLACQALLGMARDPTIAHILTKLQVGRLMSEIVREADTALPRNHTQQSQAQGTDRRGGGQGGGAVNPPPEPGVQNWASEFKRAALELIALTANQVGKASAAAASEAATSTMRRIEKAAITAATPISYPSRELLQLVQEHLVASGLYKAAQALQEEAALPPLAPPTAPPTEPPKPTPKVRTWPSDRTLGGFLTEGPTSPTTEENPFNFSTPSMVQGRRLLTSGLKPSRPEGFTKQGAAEAGLEEDVSKLVESPATSPRASLKRKAGEPLSPRKPPPAPPGLGFLTPQPPQRAKQSPFPIALTPVTTGRPTSPPRPPLGTPVESTPAAASLSCYRQYSTPARLHPSESQLGPLKVEPDAPSLPLNSTLDSIVTQYLKHQHKQCPNPITTLPPLSLLNPHICPEPRRQIDAPANSAARLLARQRNPRWGGFGGRRHNTHFVYERFRPLRTCRDTEAVLTSACFLPQTSSNIVKKFAVGSHSGELRLYDTETGDILDTHLCHEASSVMLLQSAVKPGNQGGLLLSSSKREVKLWDAESLETGYLHLWEGVRAARFNNAGTKAVAVEHRPLELRQAVLPPARIYDVNTGQLQQTLSESNSGSFMGQRGLSGMSSAYFSPSDTLVLWGGVLWDYRVPQPIHRFDLFSDYGGGAFHPTGNEVIINSEVWDLRSYKLLKSVPSLDNTTISFNGTGDVIYAILRRMSDELSSALHPRRRRHPLYSAFRTVDATNYSEIATTPVDRCIIDLAVDPSDTYVGVVALDSEQGMDSFARLYEVGRRRPSEADSDLDDVGTESEEEDSEGEGDDESEGDDGMEVEIDLAENLSDEDEGVGAEIFEGEPSERGDSDEDADMERNIMGMLAEGAEEDDEDEDGDDEDGHNLGPFDSDDSDSGSGGMWEYHDRFNQMLEDML